INKDARRLDEVTTDELVKIVMSTEMKAGSKSVIDPLAAKIIERSKVSTVVIDGRNPQTLLDVIQGVRVGTRIIHRSYSS
ncbi:MAG: hypothetical protein ACXV2B_04320, partial [Halobacteriota archaeon]